MNGANTKDSLIVKSEAIAIGKYNFFCLIVPTNANSSIEHNNTCINVLKEAEKILKETGIKFRNILFDEENNYATGLSKALDEGGQSLDGCLGFTSRNFFSYLDIITPKVGMRAGESILFIGTQERINSFKEKFN